MPYVPPHLRSGGAPPATNSTSSDRSSGFGSYGRDRQDSRGSSSYGGSFGRRDTDHSGSYGDYRSSSNTSSRPAMANGSASAAPSAPKPAVKAAKPAWAPSARVLAMTEEQIAETRQRLNVTVEGEDIASGNVAPIESFEDMNLNETILMDLRHREYDRPTPIQCQGMPVALSGRDILGCAETGSGKTAGFALPMIQHCLNADSLKRGDGPIGLVLAPTRELAQQIDREIKSFSKTSKVRTAIVVGGTNMSEQRGDLRAGVEIVIATPGRFIDHLQQRNTSLNRVTFVVLDEADRMLDMGFEPQIKEVMQSLQDGHQTLLFSATMPEEIEALAGAYLHRPVRVKVGQVSTPTANVTQHLQKTVDANKIDDVTALLLEELTMAEANGQRMPLTIVFVERKARADEVAEALRVEAIEAAALHGGLSQGERERALRDFTAGRINVLVATDVASRGLDIKGIGHVVNLDLPRTFEDYVHRIGRTGRAGSTGRATSLYTDRDSFLVSQIKKAIHDLEQGNAFAFATGKAARQRERELAQDFKEKIKMGASNIMSQGSGPAVKVDDKLAFMVTAASKGGAADDAWDD